jgi:hypothetical protein
MGCFGFDNSVSAPRSGVKRHDYFLPHTAVNCPDRGRIPRPHTSVMKCNDRRVFAHRMISLSVCLVVRGRAERQNCLHVRKPLAERDGCRHTRPICLGGLRWMAATGDHGDVRDPHSGNELVRARPAEIAIHAVGTIRATHSLCYEEAHAPILRPSAISDTSTNSAVSATQ